MQDEGRERRVLRKERGGFTEEKFYKGENKGEGGRKRKKELTEKKTHRKKEEEMK